MKVVALLAVCLSSLFVAVAEAEYPIACWTYMRFEEQTRPPAVVVKDWKELGITHPLMPVTNAKSDKAAVLDMLDLCHKAGLKAIMCDERVDNPAIVRLLNKGNKPESYRNSVRSALADWGAHPACAGFYVYDEPDSNIVDSVILAAQICRQEDASKIWYVNLLPWYNWIGPRLGCNDYAKYIERVVSECGLDSMGYDFYEQQNELTGVDKGTDLYFTNLRHWMELSMRRKKFRFNVTQICMNLYNYRINSQDDFRWQISTAAAFGAKAINWFYPDMSSAVQGCSQNYRNAPINMFGERTSTYEWMATENRLFQRQYGSEFMRLTIEKVAMTGKTFGGVARFDGDKDVVAVSSPDPVLISFFRDNQGVRYMAAVNLSRSISRHVLFTFASSVTPYQRLFTRQYAKLSTNADPVAERDAGGRQPHRAGRYLAPGQLLLVKLHRNAQNYDL